MKWLRLWQGVVVVVVGFVVCVVLVQTLWLVAGVVDGGRWCWWALVVGVAIVLV